MCTQSLSNYLLEIISVQSLANFLFFSSTLASSWGGYVGYLSHQLSLASRRVAPSTRSLTTRTRVYSLFSPLFSFDRIKSLYDLYARIFLTSLAHPFQK